MRIPLGAHLEALWPVCRYALACVLVLHNLSQTQAEDNAESPRPLPEYAGTAQELLSLTLPSESATHSACGKVLATGHHDGSILLWDLTDKRPLKRMHGHEDGVSDLAFGHSGDTLISAGYDADVCIWNVRTAELQRTLRGHTKRVATVAISPDERRVASGGYDRTVRLWSLDKGEEPIVLPEHESTIRDVAFAPDGRRFASVDDAGVLRLWETEGGSLSATHRTEEGPLLVATFSPSGDVVVTGSESGTVRFWTVDAECPGTPEERKSSLLHHPDAVTHIEFAEEGDVLATADRRGVVRLWGADTHELLSTLEGHAHGLTHMGFLPTTGAVLTTGFDQRVQLWETKLPASPRLAVIGEVEERIWALAISPVEPTLYVAGGGGLLATWDLRTGERTGTLAGFEGTIDDMALSTDGRWLAAAGWKRESVLVWQPESSEPALNLPAGAKVRCVHFSPDQHLLVAGCDDGALRVWTLADPEQPQIVGGGPSVYGMSFSPDGRFLATAHGDWQRPEPGSVILWQCDTWAQRDRRTDHVLAARTVRFSRDGALLASGGEDGEVLLWQGTTPLRLGRLQHASGIRPLAFSPDGQLLAAGQHDGTISVWDTRTHELTQRLVAADDVFALAFSCDGSVLCSSSGEREVEIWPIHRERQGAETTTADIVRGWAGDRGSDHE